MLKRLNRICLAVLGSAGLILFGWAMLNAATHLYDDPSAALRGFLYLIFMVISIKLLQLSQSA